MKSIKRSSKHVQKAFRDFQKTLALYLSFFQQTLKCFRVFWKFLKWLGISGKPWNIQGFLEIPDYTNSL